jgi:hypothetical protein
VFTVGLSPAIWYPPKSYAGFGSTTYAYFGYGAVFWHPNHYWVYFGKSVLELTNSSSPEVTVNSVDQHGATIFGYYVLFSDSSGHLLQTGFTPHTFSAMAGQKYTVQVENYQGCTFSNWTNGVKTPELTLQASSGGNAFTAVFNC